MTKREKHEIKVATDCVMNDRSNEIRNLWLQLHYDLDGLRDYVRNECVAFWTDFNPYLDKEYLDYEYICCGNRIINIDDLWCFIRDGLKEECETENKEK